ncbi:hypothetical protein WICANDRAFT_61128 [Wickerhamomyces anomalus NRRL Y-366-8]|uniref:Uncharacterized protein n=1 Tax=Wickerhamomyces anomalus (strain ATCC 58044 / CBS 1984 / NCYC 433 / NRRL Y-366-8) TaxID=683960 RepID=A0A1E3P6Q1_WICAA|nr:uncharacterized protein WICANDRAFT_61128 [Wickerhamomyces anomalus NRRL Y-366-8]ODQ60557.1 hypothetical protein WICANDRAFT_61128 [Wickerhamomyces anomalus NRRL Y-366-8]
MSQRKEIDVFDCCDGDRIVKRSADEEIAERVGGLARVPVKLRDDKFQLPDSDLLKVLHYYISNKYPEKARIFEETSLITMGLLVEHWMDEFIGETSAQMYAEFANGDGASSQTSKKIAERNEWKRTHNFENNENKRQKKQKDVSSDSDSESSSS